MLREAQKISRPLPLISRKVPRFYGGSLWHSTPDQFIARLCFFELEVQFVGIEKFAEC